MGKLFVIASFVAVVGGCTKKSGNDQAPPPPTTPAPDPRIAEATQFVTDMDAQLRKLLVEASVTEWANETDITPEHEKTAADASAAQAKGVKQLVEASRKFDAVLDQLEPATRRQLKLLKFISPLPAPDDPKQADQLAAIASEMTSIYGKGKACTTKGGKEECRDLAALDKVLQTSHRPDELLAAWQGWHDSVGHAEREPFAKYVELANAGARSLGFTDVGQWWKSGYDMTPEQFEAETDRLYNQLKPLYTQLHCYTRAKLNKLYGDKVIGKTGPIPAHLTGNMWAQTWTYLYKELEPFPGQPTIDVTPTLAKPDYDDKKMVKIAEGFYTSLGFPALPATFWERSMFQKPAGKDAVCHASSWDVTYSDDLRIKMCIQKNQEDLDTIHHELGHSFYFAAYYKLPIIFQQGANDGFHEAIGDTVVLSETPTYLKERGLLDKVEANDKVTINRQMAKALDKIAFLPWGLMVDKWRWDVFSGKVKPEDWNKHWWDLRLQYEGISPPVARTVTDFDPGSKYHVPANVPYMRYFLAAVLQFQFQRALCKKAGFTGPLHECSIYKNPEAGKAFWAMLQKGASQPWQDTLFELTGSREMDATAMLEYFQPLQTWLEAQNKGQTCGW